MKEKKKSL